MNKNNNPFLEKANNNNENIAFLIDQTRQYLDYIEEHYLNIQKVWVNVTKIFKKEKFIYDDFEYSILSYQILIHDISKLSHEEFIPYRDYFFVYKNIESLLVKNAMEKAWENHLNQFGNIHHYQTIQKYNYHCGCYPNLKVLHLIHMCIDWIAMGIKFNNSAIDYYKKEKHLMKFKEKSDYDFIEWFLETYYDYKENSLV
jgi:hypothetical protein